MILLDDNCYFTQFGGRVALMHKLQELGDISGLPVAKFGGIPHDVVRQLEERLANVDEASHTVNRSLREELFEKELEKLTSGIDNELGLPVMKLSYLDNNCPEYLSFAGVGATSIPRGDLTSRLKCFVGALSALDKPYASYYGRSHAEFSRNDVGIMLMEHLPTKDIWGTAWSIDEGMIIEIQSKYSGICHMRFAPAFDVELSNRRASFNPLMLESIRSLRRFFAVAPESDIEFCIDDDGLMLTQWRPIPYCARNRISCQLSEFAEGDCPPPYASSEQVGGLLRCLRPDAIDSAVEFAARAESAVQDGEIWIGDYHGQLNRIGLFKILDLASKSSTLVLPPLISIIGGDAPWGHLQAVAAEDPRVSYLGYAKLKDAESFRLHDGGYVELKPDSQGWLVTNE